MRSLVIQAPPGAVTVTFEDDDGRAVYHLSPVDGVLRMVLLGSITSAMREHIRPAAVQQVGQDRILCPLCDGWPIDCRLCEVDGTISERGMVAWMIDQGEVVGDAAE